MLWNVKVNKITPLEFIGKHPLPPKPKSISTFYLSKIYQLKNQTNIKVLVLFSFKSSGASTLGEFLLLSICWSRLLCCKMGSVWWHVFMLSAHMLRLWDACCCSLSLISYGTFTHQWHRLSHVTAHQLAKLQKDVKLPNKPPDVNGSTLASSHRLFPCLICSHTQRLHLATVRNHF